MWANVRRERRELAYVDYYGDATQFAVLIKAIE